MKLRDEYSPSSSILLQALQTGAEEEMAPCGFGDINDHLNLYTSLLDRLAKLGTKAARREVLHWPVNENTVFDQIRIWAAGETDIHPSKEAAEVLLELEEETFWGDQHRFNILNTLSQR